MNMKGFTRRFLRSTCVRWCVCLLVVAGAAAVGTAHNAGNSYLYLQIYPDRISGRFEIALSDPCLLYTSDAADDLLQV